MGRLRGLSRVFRIVVLPLLLGLPMVVASWDPGRFIADARCLTFFVLMTVGLAVENAIVDGASVEAALQQSKKLDRRTYELAALTNIACYYAPVWEYFHLAPVLPRGPLSAGVGLFLMVAGEGISGEGC